MKYPEEKFRYSVNRGSKREDTMLKTILSPFSEKAYAVLRIVSGFFLAFAGAMKLFGFLLPMPKPEMGSQAWIGAVIELVAGTAILLGLFTRGAAFVASGTMAVAYWQFHVFANVTGAKGVAQYLPNTNGGMPAALLCFIFLYIACKGAGSWSIDQKREAAKAGS
jgi:putative oxidoreductase